MVQFGSIQFGSLQLSSLVRRWIVPGVVIASLGAASMVYGQDSSRRGRKYKAPPPTSHVVVTVLRSTTGKPLTNASVIFHPITDGHDDGNMELKTNDEGQAILDLLETGSTVRIQILADGWQTYGKDYKVDKDNMSIEVKMNRPVGQYSIYKDNGGVKTNDGAADKTKPDEPKADSSSDAQPKDQSSDGKPSDAKSDAPKDDAKPKDSSQPK